MSFSTALAFVKAREGGYVHDPDDPGGATNFGITQGTYDAWRDEKGWDRKPVAEICDAEVDAIYRDRYWNPAHAYDLPAPLYLVHFDAAVNHGVKRAVMILQKLVGTASDGAWGPKTMHAVQVAIEQGRVAELAHEYLWRRLALYRHIVQGRSTSLKFLPGWIRRMEHLWEAMR